MASQIGARMAFQNAQEAVKRAGLNPVSAVLSSSFLRLETTLSATQTAYKFDVLVSEQTQAANFATQKKLNLQDAFIANEIGIFLYVPTTAAGLDGQLLTYPTVGNMAGVAGNFTAATAPAGYLFYQGVMELTVNQRTILTGWDVSRHLRVPLTQANTQVATGVAATVPPLHYPNDAIDFSQDGFYPCEPNLVLDGSKQNNLTITLPTATGTLPSHIRAAIVMRGILAQNVSKIN